MSEPLQEHFDAQQTMGLAEALERMDDIRATWLRHARSSKQKDIHALGVVLTAARENHAAKVVATTHQLVERAREMGKPHPFKPIMIGRQAVCFICGAPESDPIHQTGGAT